MSISTKIVFLETGTRYLGCLSIYGCSGDDIGIPRYYELICICQVCNHSSSSLVCTGTQLTSTCMYICAATQFCQFGYIRQLFHSLFTTSKCLAVRVCVGSTPTKNADGSHTSTNSSERFWKLPCCVI